MTNGLPLPKMGFSGGQNKIFLNWALGELFRMSRDCDKEQFTLLFYFMFQKSQSATKNKTRLKEYVNI